VGPPYFNATVLPLAIPLLLAMPFGPLLAWKRGDLLMASRKLITVTGLTLTVMVIAYTLTGAREGFAFLGVGLGAWMFMGAGKDLFERMQVGRANWRQIFNRARGLPRSAYGTALAHAGLGVLVIGVAAAG
jgi:cytochrome c-type biogenesis protein CcmF